MRLDIDTPADLPPLLWHPETPSLLRRYLEDALPDTFRQRWAVARQVLQTPAQAVALIGRVSPDARQQLNRQTHCWVQVYAEERGMVASGRHCWRSAFVDRAADATNGTTAILEAIAGLGSVGFLG